MFGSHESVGKQVTSLMAHLLQWWHQLTSPPANIVDLEMRFRLRVVLSACVLTAFVVPISLLIVLINNLPLLIVSILATWVGTTLTIWIARSRHYRYAFLIATTFCMVLLMLNIALSSMPPSLRVFFIVAPLLLYSFLWSVPITLLLTILQIVLAVVLSGLPTSEPDLIASSISSLISASIFIILGSMVRAQTFHALAQRTQQLEQSEARFRGAIEGSLDAFYFLSGVHDERGKLVDFTVAIANERGVNLLINPPPNLIGMRASWIVAGLGQLEHSLQEYIRVVETNTSFEREFLVPPNLFKAKWLHIQVVSVGHNLALTCRDITERKENEALLMRREQEFRTLAENLPNPVGRIARDRSFLYLNPSFAVAFKGVEDNLLGRHVEDLPMLPPQVHQQTIQGLEAVFITGEPIRFEFNSININGQEQVYSARLIPEKDESNQVKTVLTIVRNITEAKRAERERLELALERERMRLLRQFVGDVSHDLMTPLAVIKNSLYLMRRVNKPDNNADFTSQISTQTDHLEKMIRDMLLLSQLDDAGHEDFHFTPTDLNALVGSFAREHQALAAKKNQRLLFEAAETPIKLPIDQDKLWRVLTNLVHNAVKYTPEEGTIIVSIGQADANKACIQIRDTGVGIPEQDLPHIFERFFKGKTHRPNEGGSGLGLSIAQRIIEAHQGSLSVESKVGVGTTFRILLPTEVPLSVQS